MHVFNLMCSNITVIIHTHIITLLLCNIKRTYNLKAYSDARAIESVVKVKCLPDTSSTSYSFTLQVKTGNYIKNVLDVMPNSLCTQSSWQVTTITIIYYVKPSGFPTYQ